MDLSNEQSSCNHGPVDRGGFVTAPEISIGVRIPVVVWEILLGMTLGPAVLGLASISHGELRGWFASAGLAALLLMAGMDIDFGRVRGQPIELAVRGWLLSLGLGLFLCTILWVLGIVQAPMIVALALSTTALGIVPLRGLCSFLFCNEWHEARPACDYFTAPRH